ncbi:MAG: response regulator transcription factor [Clostridia bacterium]|nr:response regulator transcription factor [Clostridia bacterium]
MGSRKMKVAIVEDDAAFAARLEMYIEKFAASGEDAFSIDKYETGLKFLSHMDGGYDLVFMDIDMPVLGGMETAKALYETDKNVFIIFCTNLAQYAVKGYEVEALDFMVKPVDYETFRVKMGRAVKKIENSADNKIVVKSTSGLVRLSTSEIYYIECVRHYLHWHTFQGTIEERGKIAETEESLKKYGFMRCVSGIIVNLEHVAKITQTSVFVGKEELPLSRRRRKEFIDGYMIQLSKKV